MGRRNKDWQRLLKPVPGIDWARIVIHGLFGLVVGAVIGLSLWTEFPWQGPGGWLIIAIPAVAAGAIAALLGDRFWDWLTGRWS